VQLGWTECPRKAILSDLQVELNEWQEAGDRIIILTDFNEDVQLPWIRQFFANINLIEAILTITRSPRTATYNRGTMPIDGIYVSPDLLPLIQGGYLAFDAGIPSDHRALWIDIPGSLLGLDDEGKLRKPGARRLQCRDPRVMSKYAQSLVSQLEQENAFQRIGNLVPAMNRRRLMREQQQEYEEIDRVATTARQLAEKQCRKFKMGKVPWTPDLTKKIYQILYWKGVISQVLGRHVGTLVLRTRARKGGLQHSLQVLQSPMEQLQSKLAKAYRQYQRTKK